MRIKHTFNLLYYTPRWWEKALLFFLPMQTSEKPDSTIWYKQFFNRLYICGYIRITRISSDVTEIGYDNAGNN